MHQNLMFKPVQKMLFSSICVSDIFLLYYYSSATISKSQQIGKNQTCQNVSQCSVSFGYCLWPLIHCQLSPTWMFYNFISEGVLAYLTIPLKKVYIHLFISRWTIYLSTPRTHWTASFFPTHSSVGWSVSFLTEHVEERPVGKGEILSVLNQ